MPLSNLNGRLVNPDAVEYATTTTDGQGNKLYKIVLANLVLNITEDEYNSLQSASSQPVQTAPSPSDSSSFAFTSITTADSAASMGDWNKEGYLRATVSISNTGGSGASVQLFGSVDGSRFVSLRTLTLAANTTDLLHVSDYLPYLRLRAASATAATPTTLEATGVAIAL